MLKDSVRFDFGRERCRTGGVIHSQLVEVCGARVVPREQAWIRCSSFDDGRREADEQ
jgi:hypothetical protein